MHRITESEWQNIYARLVESVNSNFLILDKELNIVQVNPRMKNVLNKQFGIDIDQNTSLVNALSTANIPLEHDFAACCLEAAKGDPIKIEESFSLNDEDFHWEFFFKSIPVNGSHFISVFSRDITAHKENQKIVVEREANMRSTIDAIDDSIWLINDKYELIDFNRKFFTDYKKAYNFELRQGVSILEFFPEYLNDLKDLWEKRYKKGLEGSQDVYYDEYEISGELRMFEIKTFPIVEKGRVTGLTIYSRDTTEEIRQKELLREQNDELTRINAELDRFVYSASHDLKSPLMSIKGLLNLWKSEGPDDMSIEYIHLIEDRVDKLNEFIVDIIDYSRNARLELEPVEIDFEKMIRSSVDSVIFLEEAEGIEIKQEVNGVPFYSDNSRIQIIFNNIVGNAIRYQNKYLENPYLHIRVIKTEKEVQIEFEDNGVGIKEEYLDSIFKMFFRANNTTEGSGLGLYIVKSAVERLHGSVHVKSEVNKGTTFTIKLPNLRGNV